MKRSNLYLFAVCLVAAAGFVSVVHSAAQATRAGQARPLTGTQWNLLEVHGKHVPQNGLEGYFRLKASDRYEDGSSGTIADAADWCPNQIAGTYAATRDRLRIDISSSTLVACKVPAGGAPPEVSTILAGTHRFQVYGATLKLLDENGVVVARFAAAHPE